MNKALIVPLAISLIVLTLAPYCISWIMDFFSTVVDQSLISIRLP